MPKDGPVAKGRAAATKSPTKSQKDRRDSHRASDLAGIICLAIAALLLLALGLGQTGALGDGLAGLFRTLFGNAAWMVPVVLILAGWRLLAGRAAWETGRILTSAALLFLAITAALAKPINGDFFDPVAVSSSGGYIGAIGAWALTSLLGRGFPVGIILLSAVALVLALERPIRELLPKRKLEEDTEPEPAPEHLRPRRKLPLDLNPIEVDAAPVRVPDRAVTESEAVPARKRPIPVIRENDAPALATSAPAEPKEGYVLPPMSLLTSPATKSKRDPKEVERNIAVLEDTLAQFNIDANVVEVATGPTVTRYELQVGPGIKVGRISNLADNLAMTLAASHVRVEAPIPGKSAVGIEVPSKTRQTVALRELCESLEFFNNEARLYIALGKDVTGEPIYTDLTRMPHLLIGGATNSGKSIGLASLIMSLILRNTPKEVRLVMIDPKRVELSLFEGLPHLMCPVVKDVKEAPGVLRAVWREMDRRYEMFEDAAVRNIEGYNNKASYADRLPYIVVVIDELADLMIQAAAEVETSICRLAQLARATGIHLVIATQRPSVDVITGTIKANISSRIAFAVSSQIDSRTIIDMPGADQLIGRGDMLFLPIDQNKPKRIQSCYVTEAEIEAVCTHWRQQESPNYSLSPISIIQDHGDAIIGNQSDQDPLWEEAVRWVVERQQASTSMLQRKFSIGFQRASRLLDAMEEQGIVGPRDGSKPREILLDPMDVELRFGRGKYMEPVPEDQILDWDES